jgi:ferric-dicitrate binding protein FerR (iron transport regulator)
MNRLRTLVLGMAAAAVFGLTIYGPVLWHSMMLPDSSTVRDAAGFSQEAVSNFSPVDPIKLGDLVSSSKTPGRQVILTDGTQVEMRAGTEFLVANLGDGLAIQLRAGSIIVNAPKQRTGHLYVQTRDVTVTVVGAVFLVNAEDDGSRVAVIEGEVQVREGAIETSLRPGQQVSTSSTLTRSLREEIAWSRHADAHLAILAAF